MYFYDIKNGMHKTTTAGLNWNRVKKVDLFDLSFWSISNNNNANCKYSNLNTRLPLMLYVPVANKHKYALLSSWMNAFNHFVVQFYYLLFRHYRFGCMPSNVFICFPSSCLKSKHSCVSQSCDFWCTLLLIRFSSYFQSRHYTWFA